MGNIVAARAAPRAGTGAEERKQRKRVSRGRATHKDVGCIGYRASTGFLARAGCHGGGIERKEQVDGHMVDMCSALYTSFFAIFD